MTGLGVSDAMETFAVEVAVAVAVAKVRNGRYKRFISLLLNFFALQKMKMIGVNKE
jgi:hypothetical protein